MLKQNDVRTKRGVDLAEHLVGFYQAQERCVACVYCSLLVLHSLLCCSYFTEGTKLMSALKSWEEKLTTQVSEVRYCIKPLLPCRRTHYFNCNVCHSAAHSTRQGEKEAH